MLVERTGDLRQLERLVASGGIVTIAGPPGIGKTALLEHAAAVAEDAGLRVLGARASELEQTFAFGVVEQLLGTVPGRSQPDLHATLHGLLWQLMDLGPVLVHVDDAQWADEASARWLAYVARRLDRGPVAVVVTVRTDDAGREAQLPPGTGELHRVAIGELLGGARITPAALSEDAVTRVLAEHLDGVPEPGFAAACRRLTGGNPFLLTELATELAEANVPPVASAVSRLGGVVPDRVGASVRRRLATLTPDARALAEATAILGTSAELPVAAAVAGLGEPESARAARALADAHLLADAGEARFRHPLLRTAVEAAMPAPERVVRHARAADLLAARGAPSGRIAVHLLAAGGGRGDERAVEHLRAAAAGATAEGLPEHAATLLRRALDEPAANRAEVLRELGVAEASAFAPTAAERLREALALTDDPAARADVALRLVLAEYQRGRTGAAVDVALAAIEDAARHPELREPRLLLEALAALVGRYDLAALPRVRGRIQALAATLAGATPAERFVLSVAASEQPATTAAELVASTQRAIAVLDEDPLPFPYRGIGEASQLLHADAAGEAQAFAAERVRRAQATGSPVQHAVAIAVRALVALETGALPAAAADLDDAMATLRDVGELRAEDDQSPLGIAAFRVLLHAEQAEFAQAEALLAAVGLDGELPERMTLNPLLYARGTLRLLAGRPEAASADFRELGRRHEAWGIRRPSPPWRSALALALGATDEARRLAHDELELARAWGTARAIARATRAVALTGDTPIPLLSDAEARLADGPWRLDRVRVRCDLGAALRRAGERLQARAILAAALDEAHACGAEALARRAADELRRSGARPRRRAISGLDALTPSELRVAELAAAGRSNREIAQALFVTLATVETHLTRVYRKLDVSGRSALAAALE